ncbi:cell cycle control protein Cdc123 [Microthyrium microscopicum]|uniref:Cell cycle control protein Cdc123 n=1 Tax=Microthyrium microscopicum TaxID=703497 RepID=A0A6A6UJ02_9PEZI|nr:cell cycle control protein Cdc123 [Microthyrium microscopicum]
MSNATIPEAPSETRKTLPFPPITKQHILNCSFHSWYPGYRSLTPKARLLPLPQPFVDYLRADGIVLPNDENERAELSDDSGIFSSNDNDGGDDHTDPVDDDPAAQWRDFHDTLSSTISSLGGKVVPKLNWSAPKDATWISATNSMECQSADDVYLLLKSSDFITHDLDHAFDDTAEDESITVSSIPFHLVLRKYFQLNPSLEFRCFVRNKKLIAICQRDLNHFGFLFQLQSDFKEKIQKFFDTKLRDSFPDDCFTFDVYLPPPHQRVWLIDINPWAMRTDPLLFSWLELLTMEDESTNTAPGSELEEADFSGSEEEDVEEFDRLPIFRLIKKDDPEAYGFATQQYSAHKLPKDVVDASKGGEVELREFSTRWNELLERSRQTGVESDDDE